MAMLSQEKRDLLKQAFIAEGMTPGEAAKKVGVTYATANRYYELWSDEIKRAMEQQLVPQMQQSIKRLGKRRKR